MNQEQRDALRQYILCIIEDGPCGGDYLNDSLHTLAELHVPTFIIQMIQYLGWLLAMVGGF
jgi:hypothetical protein